MPKLSEVFAKLKAVKVAPNSKAVTKRVQVLKDEQKNKRTAKMQSNRGVVTNNSSKKPTPKKIVAARVKVGGRKKTAKRGAKKGTDEKPKTVNPADLDKEMDSYWFKAGKGPNPDLAALDRQMEEYRKSKPNETAA